MKIELTHDGRGIRLDRPPYDTEGLTCCILGNKGAGKSNTLAVIAESSHAQQIPFIFYDPNGDAASLRELGDDVIVIGNTDHDEPIRRADQPLEVAQREAEEFIRMVLHDGFSLVLDLSDNNANDDPDDSYHPLFTFINLINQHFQQAGQLRTPAFILVDEAHCFAPQTGANKLEKRSKRALGRVATDGRKRGMALVVATQRTTYLDKRIIFGANLRVFGKFTWRPDYDLIQHYIPFTFNQMQKFKSGEVVINQSGQIARDQIRLRTTTDLGKTPAFRVKANRARPSKTTQLQLPIDQFDS